jgi:hypothetical protein
MGAWQCPTLDKLLWKGGLNFNLVMQSIGKNVKTTKLAMELKLFHKKKFFLSDSRKINVLQ